MNAKKTVKNTPENLDQVKIIGLDIGAGQMKGFTNEDNTCIPTSIKKGKTPIDELVGGKSDLSEWNADGQIFTVGEKVNGVKTGVGAWYTSLARTVGAHQVMANLFGQDLNSQGHDVSLVFCTPLDKFYLPNGEKNVDSINAQNEAIKLPVKALKGLENRVINTKVIPEGVGAVIDWRLNNDGQIIQDRNGATRLLCVDAGESTCDMADVTGLSVNLETSCSTRLGIGKALTALKNMLPDGLDNHLVRSALHNGMVTAFGESVNCKIERDQVLKDLAEELIYFLQTNITNPANYTKILLVGGGATALSSYLTAESLFPSLADRLPPGFITVPDMPHLANARGAYKFAMRDARKK